MPIHKAFSPLLERLKEKLLGEMSDVPFSIVNIDYLDYRYHGEALEKRISIQRLPDGGVMLFSTDKGAPHQELTEMVFDGFEWELTTLMQMIDIYEARRPD
jgi:hypothetical protein